MLNGFWAIGNRTWIGLLCFIPVLGFAISIVLGIKGREWAWQNQSWASVEQFNAVQRKWSIAAFVVIGVFMVIGLLGGIGYGAYQDHLASRDNTESSSASVSNQNETNTQQDVSTLDASSTPTTTTEQPPAAPAAAPNLPFVGKRTFNFEGGSGTGEIITIASDGSTEIQACGDLAAGGSCQVEYKGPYQSPLRASDVGLGWLIQGGQIYRLDHGNTDKSCGNDEQQVCTSSLDSDS